MKRCTGFTLLELMIAILLFAMISTAAYKLFDSVSRAQLVTDGILDRLDEIQRVQVILEKDLLQIVARPIRDEFGDRQPAVQSPTKDGHILQFTRTGWRNPLGEIRSNLQRVAYELDEGKLIRYYWPMLDRAPDPVVVTQVVLEDVQRVKVRFLDEKKRWHNSWPPANQKQNVPQPIPGPGGTAPKQPAEQQVMPHAIEMTVQHLDFGNIVTILPLIDYKVSDQQKAQEKDQKDKNEKGKKPESDDEDEDDEEEGI